MKLATAKRIANKLIRQHVPAWQFRWDGAKRRFGCCKYGIRTITISKQLTLLNDEDQFTDTMLHEIAHALVGRPGKAHGQRWVEVALRIGCSAEVYYDEQFVKQPEQPWKLVCASCGFVGKRYRRPRKRVACIGCCNTHNHGRFDSRFILTLEANNGNLSE